MTKFANYNPPTVVVPILGVRTKDGKKDGILTVQRGIEPEIGKLCLPGGYQEMGETWQEALSREILEETGYQTQVSLWHHWKTITVENGTKNLLFATQFNLIDWQEPVLSNETLAVHIWREGEITIPWAFPIHKKEAEEYYWKDWH